MAIDPVRDDTPPEPEAPEDRLQREYDALHRLHGLLASGYWRLRAALDDITWQPTTLEEAQKMAAAALEAGRPEVIETPFDPDDEVTRFATGQE